MVHLKVYPRLTGWQFQIPEEVTLADRLADLAKDIAQNPAFHRIVEFLSHAKALGLDPADPAVVLRAIDAGEAAFKAALPPGEQTNVGVPSESASYDLFNRVVDDRHAPIVYYMRRADQVKIGTTTCLANRLSDIQPQGVLALEPGGRAEEQARHERFASLRLRGEWFQLDSGLAEHIADIREVFAAQAGMTVESWVEQNTRGTVTQPRRPKGKSGSPGSFKRDRPIIAVALPGQPLPDDAAELLPASRVARALGVSHQLVGHWLTKGKIRPVAMSADGRRLYRLSEVMAVPRKRAA